MRWAKRKTPAMFPTAYSRLIRIAVAQCDAYGEARIDTEYRGTLKEMLKRADDFRHYRKCLRDNRNFEESELEARYKFRLEKVRIIDDIWGLELHIRRKSDLEMLEKILG